MRNVIIGVILGCLFIIAGSIKAPIAHAQAPQVIGHGCTTAYFIDDDCDGCGVGVKSSGQYPLTQNPPAVGTPAYYTMGDTPDADDTDPTVCTTAPMAGEVGHDKPGDGELPAAAQGLHQHEPHLLHLAKRERLDGAW